MKIKVALVVRCGWCSDEVRKTSSGIGKTGIVHRASVKLGKLRTLVLCDGGDGERR